jgi:hypothetical protein
LIRLACPGHDSMSQPSGDKGHFVQGKLFVPPQIRLVGKALSVGVSVAVWSTPLLLSVWASCPGFHCMRRAHEKLVVAGCLGASGKVVPRGLEPRTLRY